MTRGVLVVVRTVVIVGCRALVVGMIIWLRRLIGSGVVVIVSAIVVRTLMGLVVAIFR